MPISALQHLLFCERQCALIHLEQQWKENRLTAEGRLLHERVDSGELTIRGDVCIARGLLLHCFSLGLVGKADAVELHRCKSKDGGGFPILGQAGNWTAIPIEYKRGRPKHNNCDKVQLCAQGMCLEEMLSCKVEKGFIYYGTQKKRLEVPFDNKLRATTREAAQQLHILQQQGKTPSAKYDKKCDNCSLMDLCMPLMINGKKSVKVYLQNMLARTEI